MTGADIFFFVALIVCLIGVALSISVNVSVRKKGEKEPLKLGIELDKLGSVRLRNEATGQYLDTGNIMQKGFRIGTSAEHTDHAYHGVPYVQLRFVLESIDGVPRKGLAHTEEIPREFLLRKLQEAGDD